MKPMDLRFAPHLLRTMAVCLGLLALWACQRKTADDAPEQPVPQQEQAAPTARIVMEVSKQSRLYTTEYQIHKLVTFADNPTLEGKVLGVPVKMKARWGDRKVAIPVDLTLKGYIDFSDFSTQNVLHEGDKLIVILPDPQVVATASKVDHQGTRQYIDPLRSRFTDAELAELTRQGADSILSHTGQLGIAEQARKSATALLVPMLCQLGYDERNIIVRFRKSFDETDIQPHLQKN